MSEIARQAMDRARTDRENQNDANHILRKVNPVRGNPAVAEERWPFELIQNAHDAGSREGQNRVDVAFVLSDDGNLVVSHTGKHFESRELEALLTGGSSKEYEGKDTTGRFGSGFLSTHVLSTRVQVEGILSDDTVTKPEFFCVELNRDGDVAAIKENIGKTREAFSTAEPLAEAEIANRPTASFTYYTPAPRVVDSGLNRLERTIPYLYATCDNLGEIRVQRPGQTALFSLDNSPAKATEEIDGFRLKHTEIRLSADETDRQFTAIRIGCRESTSGLLVVLEHDDARQGRVLLPESSRIFIKFPIAGTGFLPFNVVLDGNFKPKEERDGIEMDHTDKELIEEALSAFPAIIQYAVKSGWRNAHELARLAVPKRPLGAENVANEEKDWWQAVILGIAKDTAAQPIIETEAGFLPALVGAGEHASFLVSAVDKNDLTPVDATSIRGLADRVTGLHLPVEEVAQDWKRMAREWDDLGLFVERLGLTELTDWVKERGKSVSDLPINGDRFRWLADLFLLAAELPEGIDSRPRLNGLIPDQHSQLRRLQDLRIDEGITEVVKDIADAVGIDLRAELVHGNLMQALDAPGYEPAKDLIQELLQTSTETQAVDRVLEQLEGNLPGSSVFVEHVALPLLRASAQLAIHLASVEDVQRIRKCPLLASDDSVVRLTSNQILAPVFYWPESSRPYAELYTKNRVLSDRYSDDTEPEMKESLQSLIEENLVVPKPFYQGPRLSVVDGPLLKAMAPECPSNGVNFGSRHFGQIAFLSNELVPRCGNNEALAKLLLGFVTNVAAKEDEGWGDTWTVNLRTQTGEQHPPFQSYSSTWPFELKVRSWVPVPFWDEHEERERIAPTPATAANLRELLDPNWFRNNPHARDFLQRVFGFRPLTLLTLENLDLEVENNLVRLSEYPGLVNLAAANLDAVRVAVENPAAAQLLSELGAEGVQEIQAELDVKKRQAEVRTRNNNFGHAVQAAVKEAVESLGLNLKLIDSGFDYEVFPDNSSFSFEVGSYFLEVKSTVSRDVRLTPKQAETACKHPDRFVLCVVDLEDFPNAHAKENWQAVDVVPHAKIVTDIGGDFEEIYEGVTEFADAGNPVRLRNEEQLRYGVSPDIWEKGVSIAEWVESLKGSNQPPV